MIQEFININDFELIDKEILSKANIMPKTGLATDYLNVFNEATMLFGLLGDMPDMIEELKEWEFLNYEQHFERSNFHAKDLAIAVYKIIPIERKAIFDDVAIELGNIISDSIETSQKLIGENQDISQFCMETCEVLQGYIMQLDGMIHGRDIEESNINEAQFDVDALFD